MGRWDFKTYGSDSAQEYFDRITGLILREITFRLAPEQVLLNAIWMANVITAIEMLLVFDKNDVGILGCFADQEQAVKRWREAFFSVWDAEWEDFDTYFPFHTYNYRQAHREVVVKWFDRLDELALFWTSDDPNQRLSEYGPEVRLPYFSTPYASFIFDEVIERLTHSLMFMLYDDKYKLAFDSFDIDEVWVAVDVIALLYETYSYKPLVTLQEVENWQKNTIDIWKEEFSDEAWERHYEFEMYQNIIASFDKLKAVTKKYEDQH